MDGLELRVSQPDPDERRDVVAAMEEGFEVAERQRRLPGRRRDKNRVVRGGPPIQFCDSRRLPGAAWPPRASRNSLSCISRIRRIDSGNRGRRPIP